ncbi:MAG: response regulator [Anaerolineaceae bacterium]
MGDYYFPDRIRARVLVVDDHPTTASTLARVIALMGRGIEPVVANSGEQALELAQQQAVDILITDMVMPGMGGIELIKTLQSQPDNRSVYTIMMTAHEIATREISAQRLTVDRVLLKPIQPERICQIITGAIERLNRNTPANLTEGIA